MNLLLRMLALAIVSTLALMLGGARAQPYETEHGTGEMSMAAGGRFIAFTVLGRPANEFILFDTAERRAIIIEAPEPHVGDLGWSADGDELTFVTSERHAIGGEGRHVWRLRRTPAGHTVELLALIPYVRSPVLSADGARLAAFEGVIVGEGEYNALNTAYAIFERTLSDGRPTRRSEGHAGQVMRLAYDRRDALFIRLPNPVFPHARRYNGRLSYSWRSRDAAGRWDFEWRAETGGFYFRLLPGEMLPAWPSPAFLIPGVPRGADLVRPMDDGRVAMFVSQRPWSASDWYDERGQARPRRAGGPLPFDYVAYAEDGTAEMLVRTPLPEGAGRTGGADLSADGALFAQVINRRGDHRGGHMLMVFERGALSFEAPVAELVLQAERIVVAPSETPLMPPASQPHRLTVSPDP